MRSARPPSALAFARDVRSLLAVLVLLASLGIACGGSDDVEAELDTRSAAEIVAALKTDGQPIANTEDYTAENDPDKLLGRPGQYTSKTNFRDSRIPGIDLFGIDVQAGGSIEVFASEEDATRRRNYLQTVTQVAPFLVEYDYQHGALILRLSRSLTPEQAEAYFTALKEGSSQQD